MKLPPSRATILVFAVCIATWAVDPAVQIGTPQGSWAGVFRDGARSLYATFTFGPTIAGSLAATVSYPLESERTFRVAGTTFRDGVLRLNLDKGGETFQLDAIVTRDRIFGNYRLGSTQAQVELLPLRTRPRVELLPYTGDYSDGHGHDVVLSESLGVLYFLDLSSGRTGRLYPLGSDEFFGGPTRLVFAPIRVIAKFSQNDSGSFQKLRLTIDDTSSTFQRSIIDTSADVAFDVPGAHIAGTLRRPTGRGPFPAVLMLSGSNGQPRGGYYSIVDFFADHFLRRGLAVLTFDKSGVGSSTGIATDNGVEFVAAAAFRFLKRQPDVDLNRVGIWGMSEGGIIAPKVAKLEPGVRFIVNVSGSVVDANTEEIERTANMMRVDGFSESDIADAVAFQRLKFHYAESGQGWSYYVAAYNRYQHRAWFPDPYVGPPGSQSSTAWKFWRESGAIHPFDFWRAFSGAVLLLYGQHDSIGDPSENIALFVKAMKEGMNKSYMISILPGADHSMYVSDTGSWREERLLTTLDLSAFSMIDAWMASRGFAGGNASSSGRADRP